MKDGDWVFVPPFMPHVEGNMSVTEELVWLTTRTPENHRGQPRRRRRRNPRRLPTGIPPLTHRARPRRPSSTRPRRSPPPTAELFDEAYTATTQYVPVAQGLRRRHGRPGRRRRDALGRGRPVAALDAQLLHAARRHRRRSPLRGGAAARRPRLLHPAGPRLPGRQARLRRHGLLPRPRSRRGLQPRAAGRGPGSGVAAQLRGDRACSTGRWRTPAATTGPAAAASTCGTCPARSTSSVEGEPVPHQAVWVKAFDRCSRRRPATCTRAALAYVCDYTILEPVLRVHGLHWAAPGPGHRQPGPRHVVPPRRPRWTTGCSMPRKPSPRQGSRGLAMGRFFDRQGRLLATVAQEGMIRSRLLRDCPCPPPATLDAPLERNGHGSDALGPRGHLRPRPPAAGRPVAGPGVHPPGAPVPASGSTPPPR